jgi:Uma2 family endonuclease
MSRTASHSFTTLGEVLEHLGGVEPTRVRLRPEPGTANERDLLALAGGPHRYELVDGVLVEKPMSELASYLALELSYFLRAFLARHDLGYLTGADGARRLMRGLVRIPDVSFVRWERLPRRGLVPDEPIAALAPDLAVEVLSPSNTAGEMRRKLKDYFLATTQAVWVIDPKGRTVTVYDAPDKSTRFSEEETLTGGSLLPGFELPLRELFAKVPSAGSKKKPRS